MQRAATQAEAAFKRQSAETPREPPRINMTSHCGEAPWQKPWVLNAPYLGTICQVDTNFSMSYMHFFFNSFNTAEITSPLTKIIGSLQLVSYISYIYS